MKLTRQGVRDLGNSRRLRRSASSRYAPQGVRSPNPADLILDTRPRVAVDVVVSNKEIRELEAAGFCVAVVAETGEPDDAWLERAIATKVDIVCSADMGVWTWTLCYGMILVKLDNGYKTDDVVGRVRAAWESRVSQ